MRELPIIFTTDKAILEGRKLVTRRLNGLKEINKEPDRWKFSFILYNPAEAIFEDLNDTIEFRQKEKRGQKVKFVMLPYQEGDLLWVKEPFRILGSVPTEKDYTVHVVYSRDGHHAWPVLTKKEWDKFLKWKEPRKGKSSLFMFKSLARTWLEVISVRPERLQDITWVWRYEFKSG